MTTLTNHPPKLSYCGLTIILDRPSRFDTDKLISGSAGDYFDRLLFPFTRFNCDIRLATDIREFLPETKVLLLLGQDSLNIYKPEASILTYRGSPLTLPNTLIAIPTITPQDSFDRRNYENPDDEDEDDKETTNEKDNSGTSRKNFRFWFSADVRKAIRITQQGLRSYPEPQIRYCPMPERFVNYLNTCKGGYLTVDIETDRSQNLTVFSVMWCKDCHDNSDKEIFVIPFKRYDNSLLYSNIDYCYIFRALAFAFRDNLVIGHNLSFDLFVLLFKYSINPPLKVYDTMIAHHRCHPEMEKSLAHAISYYTDLPYHKDEGVFDPRSYEQEQKLWAYNAKDVWTTCLVFLAQQEEIDKLRARSSVEQGCATIRSILMMQYEGCLCDKEKLCSIVDNSDRQFEGLKRLLRLATKRAINPRSVDDVSGYLYDTLKLPRLSGKKKKTAPRKDGKDLGPTGKDVLLKLYLKYPIPSIRLIIEAKKIAKRASALRLIKLWKGDRLTCGYKLTSDTFRLKSSKLLEF